MPQLSQLMQLFRNEKAKWGNSPKLADLLMRDSSTKGIRDYAGNVQQRGATLAGLLQGREPTDAQKALFNIANPGTTEGAMELATGFMPMGVAATAWHGSPHLFDKFDLAKIGTGEGAQAYGHGAYLAESPTVAQNYRTNISDAKGLRNGETLIDGVKPRNSFENTIATMLVSHNNDTGRVKKLISGMEDKDYANKLLSSLDEYSSKNITYQPPGFTYKTDIPDTHIAKMLDWDKPLSEQSQHVQGALQTWEQANNGGKQLRQSMSGDELLRYLGKNGQGEQALNQLGIPGIKYLDGSSRAGGEGTRNFVMFNPDDIRILERNGQPTGQVPWNSR